MRNVAILSAILGALSLLLGAMMLGMPNILKRLDSLSPWFGQKSGGSESLGHRIGFGVSLILVSAFLFFMSYYLRVRY